MTRKTCLRSLAVALFASSVATISTADPVKVVPTAIGVVQNNLAMAGVGLDLFVGAQDVALGPFQEARTFYEFSLADVEMKRSESAVFSVVRRAPYTECYLLIPCPELRSLDVYGYTADGEITLGDYYEAGTLLGTVAPVPLEGRTITLDISNFLRPLLANGSGFAGIALRSGSEGGAGLRDPQVGVVPEPSTFALVLTAVIGCVGLQFRRTLAGHAGQARSFGESG